MNWRVEDFGQYIEVTPEHDIKEHWAGDECWCQPRRVEDRGDRPVISHNSLDKREDYENEN